MAKVRQARPCRAQRKHGRGPCGCYAILGGDVCRIHGGAAPQVQYAARERLLHAAASRLLIRLGVRWDPDRGRMAPWRVAG